MRKSPSAAASLIPRRWVALAAGIFLCAGGLAGSAQESAGRDEALEHAASLRRSGHWTQAQAEFKALWEADRSDTTAALAYGNLCLQNGPSAEAEAPLRAVADQGGPLGSFALYLLARCLHLQGNDGDASTLLQPLLGLKDAEGLQERALVLLADIQRASGRRAEEAATWRRMIATLPGRNLEEGARFRLAGALEGSGQARPAYDAYQDIYWNRSKSPYAREAGLCATRLAKSKGFALRSLTPQQTVEAAQRFFKAGRAADALDLLNAIPVNALKGDRALDERLLRVQILYALRENGMAVAEADRLLHDAGPRRHGLAALLKAAWALLRSGDHEGILVRGRRILEGAGDSDALRVEALHCMGTSAFARGRFAEGAGYFAQMQKLKGQPATLVSGTYKHAWCLYQTGDVAGALSLFARLANTPRAPDIAGPSAYWSARCSLELGQAATAAEGFTRLALDPPGYWGLRAREQLAAMRVSLPPEPVFGAPPDGESALRLPGAELARSLDLCGLDSDAARAFGPVYAKSKAANATDPSVAMAFALLLTRGGDAGGGRAVLGRTFGRVLARYSVEKGWLEAGCPAPYVGFVRTLSETNGADPAFVYGIMQQESDFDEAAVSPAGARGLMQLMPYTAAKLAAESGQPAPTESGLLNPILNLQLGVRYLAQRAREFPLGAAAASYNAGEDIVGGWVKAWGPLDEEQFIAMIPYAETRHYAAVVLWNRHRYRQLLGNPSRNEDEPVPRQDAKGAKGDGIHSDEHKNQTSL